MTNPTAWRAGHCCPICGAAADMSMLTLNFAPKPHLPDAITLHRCMHCDFCFTAPGDAAAYAAYYETAKNDQVHNAISPESGARWLAQQAAHLAAILATPASLRILDYGCGGGDLLRHLAAHYPHHHYTGFDVHMPDGTPGGPIVLTALPPTDAQRFDLIIFSHVVEHLVDFTPLAAIRRLLVDGGHLYIEVPDASAYGDYPRREHLYYIDRLHVNHFSAKSLLVLAGKTGFTCDRYGKYGLPYKDGNPYPAQYVILRKSDCPALAQSLAAYITAEQARPSPLAAIRGPILVYGFGDHFFRSRSAGAPLFGYEIIGVIDRRYEALNASPAASHYRFFSLGDAMRQFPDAPIVIAISWGAEEIARTIHAQYPSAKAVIL